MGKEYEDAFIADFSFFTDKLMLEHREHITEKHLTGVKAAEFIKLGDSVILDSGSTLTGLANRVVGRKNPNIITSAISITLILGTEPASFNRCFFELPRERAGKIRELLGDLNLREVGARHSALGQPRSSSICFKVRSVYSAICSTATPRFLREALI
jgi:hypothetical protein